MSSHSTSSAPWEAILTELREMRRGYERGEDELWDAIDELREILGREREDGDEAEAEGTRMAPAEYRRVRYRFRRMVERSVPSGSCVAVASRGDDRLIDFRNVVGVHFPRGSDSGYAGFYPADGTGVIAHLEWLRARDVEWLAFPESSTWWIESYPKLMRHLETIASPPLREEGVGALFRLTAPGTGWGAAVGRIDALLEVWDSTAEAPSLLEWDAPLSLEARLPHRTIFSPPRGSEGLPYLDRSIDVVVVGNAAHMPEARRVALRSVVLAEATEDGARITVEDVDGAPPSLPSVSIVVPTYNGILHLAPCLRALGETLPKPFDGEVIVVDDGSDAATTEVLATKSEEVPWLRVLRNDRNVGFIASCNRGAVEAGGRFLVFLNDDTVPLQGWLQALLRTFDAFPDAGAVGGRLVYPDGRLQEAGSVIYGDGSGANIGRGDWDVDAPRYTWVREVDYCSGALLATPRDLFSELGGFDLRYAPAYYEDTDYCFRLREEGRAVYYQPRAIVVHAEGATSGVDPTSGIKRHQVRNRRVFQDRWTRALSGRMSSPGQYSEMVWQRLTMIGAQAGAWR